PRLWTIAGCRWDERSHLPADADPGRVGRPIAAAQQDRLLAAFRFRGTGTYVNARDRQWSHWLELGYLPFARFWCGLSAVAEPRAPSRTQRAGGRGSRR